MMVVEVGVDFCALRRLCAVDLLCIDWSCREEVWNLILYVGQFGSLLSLGSLLFDNCHRSCEVGRGRVGFGENLRRIRRNS